MAAWSEMVLETAHFEVESEFVTGSVYAGYKVGFIPIRVKYGLERSKISPMRDTLRWFCWYFKTAPCFLGSAHRRKKAAIPADYGKTDNAIQFFP
jgi:hypothetical protein